MPRRDDVTLISTDAALAISLSQAVVCAPRRPQERYMNSPDALGYRSQARSWGLMRCRSTTHCALGSTATYGNRWDGLDPYDRSAWPGWWSVVDGT